MARSLAQLAQAALATQDACNLTAVVRAFAEALEDLWKHAIAEGHGTDWVNQHAITRAYVNKLTALSRSGSADETFREVASLAEGKAA